MLPRRDEQTMGSPPKSVTRPTFVTMRGHRSDSTEALLVGGHAETQTSEG